jgi:hypothetical protein
MPSIEAKFLQLVVPLPQTGVQVVGYANLDQTITTPQYLSIGDRVTVQGESKSQGEVVTVTGLYPDQGSLSTPIMYGSTPVYQCFEASFGNAHDAGATVTTMNFPRWTSTKAFLFIELTSAGANDPQTRAQVDALMVKVARGFTGWATVAASGGNIGPFVVGTSGLGTATVGTIAA